MENYRPAVALTGEQGVLPGLIGFDRASRAPISPKRPPTETAGLADIFPYYAGFSFEWACTQLGKRVENGRPKLVLDPWNGSGTTTLAAQYDGHQAIGIDLNPAANIVAQLRCQVSGNAKRGRAPRKRLPRIPRAGDPLGYWFAPDTVSRIRDWTRSFDSSPIEISALGRVALFRMVRELTKEFGGSNPTWVKKAKQVEDLVDVSSTRVDELVDEELTSLLARLAEAPKVLPAAMLTTASSARLPIPDSTVDLILTSPPYLTRIDYAVAYSRELAVLGIDISANRTLRAGLMGTTLIRSNEHTHDGYGVAASSLLSAIYGHTSKASRGYYSKQARQYLTDLCAGLDELTRVAKKGAELCLVVQDSYYKDIHVPLAAICIDESERRGWTLESADEWRVIRSLTSLNKSAREYKKGDVAESVITLRKV